MTEATVFLVKHAIQRGLLLTRPISLLDEGPASAYFGGLPQLPSTTPWPKLGGCSGSFLAQIDLSKVPAWAVDGLLPPTGLLSFFAATNFEGRDVVPSAVIYSDHGEAEVLERAPPEDLPMLYAPDGEYMFPWREAGGRTPRIFPKWPMVVVDIGPTLIPGAAELEIWELRERAGTAFETAALGLGATPRLFGESLIGRFKSDRELLGPWPNPPPRRGSAWTPDDRWPYAWVYVSIFACEVAKECGIARLGALRRQAGAIAPATGPSVEQVDSLQQAAEFWMEAAAGAGLGSEVVEADRSRFREWIWSSITAASTAGPGSRFSIGWINTAIARQLVSGTNMVLGTSPRPIGLLPTALVDYVRGWHAPVERSGGAESVLRHQLLGAAIEGQGPAGKMEQTHLLLAQFESDQGMFWNWADMGYLQFWITPEHLNERRFDEAVLTFASQ